MSFSPALYDEQLESAEEDTVALEELRHQVEGFDERLRRVEEGVSGLRGNQEQMLSMFQRLLTRHDELLNGFQDKPGLVVKVDRLENIESTRRWHLRALWVAIVGGVAKAVFDTFRK